MTHQFTNRINFFEPGGIAGFDEPVMQQRAPMFFVGIQRDISPPLVFGHSRLQRMRVIVVAGPCSSVGRQASRFTMFSDALSRTTRAAPLAPPRSRGNHIGSAAHPAHSPGP